jgi:hypothetical protein
MHRNHGMIFRSRLAIVAIAAAAMIAPGCATERDQSWEPGSVEDYIAQGQNDGYGLFDQCMGGFDLYWPGWCHEPIYYYSRGDGDNDCDDGNCARRPDGHGRHRQPEPGARTATTSSGTASHTMPVASHSSARAIASASSGGPEIGGGFGREDGLGRSGFGGAHEHGVR